MIDKASLKRVHGEKKANQMEAALKKAFEPLKDEALQLHFYSTGPVPFSREPDPHNHGELPIFTHDVLKGWSYPDGTTQKTIYHKQERWHGKFWISALAFIPVVFISGLSFFSPIGTGKKTRKEVWEEMIRIKTQPFEKFVTEAIQNIKTEIEKARAAQKDNASAA